MGSCLGGLLGAEQVLARWWAGVCSAGCLPTPCSQQSIACTGNVLTQHGPSKSNSACICLLEPTRMEDSCLAQRSPERCHPPQGLCPLGLGQLPPPGATSRWKGYGGAPRSILLLAHGETSPRGKYQCAIPALLPLPFGHRSLMSGGKQIKSHQMPAGEWKGQKLARKWFCMSFCPA